MCRGAQQRNMLITQRALCAASRLVWQSTAMKAAHSRRQKAFPADRIGKAVKNKEKGIEGKEAENERKTGTDTGKGA